MARFNPQEVIAAAISPLEELVIRIENRVAAIEARQAEADLAHTLGIASPVERVERKVDQVEEADDVASAIYPEIS